MAPDQLPKSGGNTEHESNLHLLPRGNTHNMPQALREVSLVDWTRLVLWLAAILIGAGIWYENKNVEGENLSASIRSQGEIFSERITALSGRISSLETKQTSATSDIADTKVLIGQVRNEVASVAKDLSFLAKSIQDRGEDRNRQIQVLQNSQTTFETRIEEKFEEFAQELADHRILLERAGITTLPTKRNER